MKKLSTILLLATLSTSANAAYLGTDMQFNNLSYKNPTSTLPIKADDYYNNKSSTLNIFLGTDLSPNFSIEAGFSNSKKRMSNDNTGLNYTSGALNGQALTTKSTISAKLLTFDTIQRYQVKETDFEISTILGITLAEFTFKESFNDGSTYSDKERGFGINLGLGGNYKIDDNASIRLRAKYTLLNGIEPSKINGIGEVENIFSVGIGFQVKL